MKLYSTTIPSVSVLPTFGTEEEVDAFIDQLISIADLQDSDAKNVLRLGGREERPPQGSSN